MLLPTPRPESDPAPVVEIFTRTGKKPVCVHAPLGRLPESDPAPVVEIFTRTGITAAGGQFDIERCTRKMFVHRNRKRNLLVLLYLRRKYKTQKTVLDTSNFSCKIFGRKLLHAL